MAHKYGGPWSEVKLDAVEYYLRCYTRALRSRRKRPDGSATPGMDLWYIDAFAGTGDREAEREVGGLLDGREIEIIVETLDGSARRALKVEPPFQHFIFVEKDPGRAKALGSVQAEFPSLDIRVLQGDANEELLHLVGNPPWSQKYSNSRGVVFLDPFSMQVEWTTLRALAKTQRLDVWYFFNVAAITRQLARDYSKIGNKEGMLDRVLSRRWRELYDMNPAEPIQTSLFDDVPKVKSGTRTATKSQIDAWFKGVLEDEFAFVSDPLPIVTPHAGHEFSMFLCVSNPSKAAVDLARKFVGHVNKKYAPKAKASRHRSGR